MAPRGGLVGLVAAAAACSRVLVVGLALAWDAALPDYDTSAALAPPCGGGAGQSGSLRPPGRVEAAVEGLVTWDAVYFVRVAECGYTAEQEHAFFPLLPLLMRAVAATALAPLRGVWRDRVVLALAGLLVSNGSFVASAAALFRLGQAVLGDDRAALRAAAFYVFGAAAVFQSAIYSESLFAALAFAGMLQLEAGDGGGWGGGEIGAALLFGLAGAARSNGVTLCGFLLFVPVQQLASAARAGGGWAQAAGGLLWRAGLCVVAVAPLAAFQHFGTLSFCRPPPVAAGAWPGPRPWCGRSLGPYGFVQAHYWGVGPFRYWEPRQVPNFLLAAPALALAAAGATAYVGADPARLLSLGVGVGGGGRRGGYLGTVRALPYVLHWAALAVGALVAMHVQVATRFLAACPPLYWYLAHLAGPPEQGGGAGCAGGKGPCRGGAQGGRAPPLLWGYCLGYLVLGTLLHPTFYPWT